MAWEKVKLGDVSTCIQPGPFGSQLHNSDYSESGTPIIMPKDMIDGKISHSNLVFVGEEHTKRLCRHQVHSGNLMVARKGDVRKCVFITENEEGWMTGSDCLKVALKEDVCHPKFIYYQLRSPFIGRWLEKISIGATMPSINTGLLSGIELMLPPLKTQKRIADILSAYDDLIENNQKQIKLLEEAAQRLYKQWFIDLKFPGHETTKIVDGLPEGWEKEKIDAVYNIKYGKNLPKTEIKDVGKYPVYGANGIIGYYDSPNCFQKVVLITSRGNGSGDVGCTKHKESFVTNNSFIVLPNKSYNYYGFSFIYGQMNAMDFHSITTGSAQPQLTNNSISTLNVNVPPQELITNFSGIVDNYYEKIDILYNQMFCLQIARDRLLPKLMSDEIEV